MFTVYLGLISLAAASAVVGCDYHHTGSYNLVSNSYQDSAVCAGNRTAAEAAAEAWLAQVKTACPKAVVPAAANVQCHLDSSASCGKGGKSMKGCTPTCSCTWTPPCDGSCKDVVPSNCSKCGHPVCSASSGYGSSGYDYSSPSGTWTWVWNSKPRSCTDSYSDKYMHWDCDACDCVCDQGVVCTGPNAPNAIYNSTTCQCECNLRDSDCVGSHNGNVNWVASASDSSCECVCRVSKPYGECGSWSDSSCSWTPATQPQCGTCQHAVCSNGATYTCVDNDAECPCGTERNNVTRCCDQVQCQQQQGQQCGGKTRPTYCNAPPSEPTPSECYPAPPEPTCYPDAVTTPQSTCYPDVAPPAPVCDVAPKCCDKTGACPTTNVVDSCPCDGRKPLVKICVAKADAKRLSDKNRHNRAYLYGGEHNCNDECAGYGDKSYCVQCTAGFHEDSRGVVVCPSSGSSRSGLTALWETLGEMAHGASNDLSYLSHGVANAVDPQYNH